MPKYITVIFVLTLISCSGNKTLSENEMRQITEANNKMLEQAFRNQDLDALAKIYAPNARLSPDGDRFYTGTQDVINFWRADFATSRVTEMSTTTLTVAGDRDVIYETGITRVTSTSSDVPKTNIVKYINVWARQSDNTYRLSVDFWNEANTK